MFIKKDKNIRKKFIYKYFTKYFLYGYLAFLGMLASAILFVSSLKLNNYLKLFSIIPFFTFVYSLYFLVPICYSTKNKWRYYKINTYRFQTRRFSDEWFKYEMNEPCMRLIIRDLCFENNCRQEYRQMYLKYAKKNIWLEKEKQRFLNDVIDHRRITK